MNLSFNVDAMKTGADIIQNPKDWNDYANAGLFHNYGLIQSIKSESVRKETFPEVMNSVAAEAQKAVDAGFMSKQGQSVIDDIISTFVDNEKNKDFEKCVTELESIFNNVKSNNALKSDYSCAAASVAYYSSLVWLEGIKGAPDYPNNVQSNSWEGAFLVAGVDLREAVKGGFLGYSMANAYSGGIASLSPQVIGTATVVTGVFFAAVGSYQAAQ